MSHPQRPIMAIERIALILEIQREILVNIGIRVGAVAGHVAEIASHVKEFAD